MEYIYLPIVDMKEAPKTCSKVVSQALFGERVDVREGKGEWLLIATPDGYQGWVKGDSIFDRASPYLGEIEITRLSAHIYETPDTEYGPLMTLPYGSKLQVLDATDPRWIQIQLLDERIAFIQKGDVASIPFELISFSKQFLGLPYTWGGRSSFGFDCSGYVQMIFGRLGISLPRDAREQIHHGKKIPLEELQLGDLIFWGKSEHEIKHVGMSFGGETFIHTSVRENLPFLRISKVSDFEWSGRKDAFYPFRAACSFSAQLSIQQSGQALVLTPLQNGST
jgi:cell wall-associated NlpC family hydrolase